MQLICDLEIHSKYARATSRDLDVENIANWAAMKGINIVGSGDFTHPTWLGDLKAKLEPAEPGLFRLKKNFIGKNFHPQVKFVRFLLSGEISLIYSKNGKVRKVHHLIYAPSFELVDKINTQLSWIGNLKADGRPIIGLDSKELAKIFVNTSDKVYIIPAHVWTPWFGIFGSMSGFDSLQECFEDYSKYIFAIETGLSSDPAMNWRVPFLDNISIVSFSDAHSLPKLGREATILNCELSYDGIFDAIKSRQAGKFIQTLEFFPEEGKYHFSGHRICQICWSPEEVKKHKAICSICGKKVTVGVMNRIEELAHPDRPCGFKPESFLPYRNLIPLVEIIADAIGLGVQAKAVRENYKKLIDSFNNEFNILLNVAPSEIANLKPEIAQAVLLVREGKVKIMPGYDGEYGKIKIFEENELKDLVKQSSLF